MEWKEIKDKSEGELQKLLASTREKLRDLRFNVSMGQLKQNHEVSAARKLIARILTVNKMKSGKIPATTSVKAKEASK